MPVGPHRADPLLRLSAGCTGHRHPRLRQPAVASGPARRAGPRAVAGLPGEGAGRAGGPSHRADALLRLSAGPAPDTATPGCGSLRLPPARPAGRARGLWPGSRAPSGGGAAASGARPGLAGTGPVLGSPADRAVVRGSRGGRRCEDAVRLLPALFRSISRAVG